MNRPFHHAFRFYDSYGLPLELVMETCRRRGCVAALDTFVRDAVVSGWPFEKAIGVCSEALRDQFGLQAGENAARRLAQGMKIHYSRYWPGERRVHPELDEK